jgi:hypothetical protein
MSCLSLQDDLKKFVSEPPPPPQLVEVPEEGKAKAKEPRKVGEGNDTVVVEDMSEEDETRRRCRTASSCGRGSAILAYLTSLSFRISRLAWRLVWPRRQGGRAMRPASAWPRN